MSHSSTRKRTVRRPLTTRIAGGVLGALAGGLAGRALRPLARRASRRLGVPAESMIRVIEITTPVVVCLAAGRVAERSAARRVRARRHPHRPAPAAGDRLAPRHPRATAVRN